MPSTHPPSANSWEMSRSCEPKVYKHVLVALHVLKPLHLIRRKAAWIWLGSIVGGGNS